VSRRNEALVGHLARAGWSAENLGHHVNRLAASLRLADRVHVKSPRRWIDAVPPRTVPSVPRDPWPGLVCAALSRRLHEPVSLADLGWERSAGAVLVPADDGVTYAGALVALRELVEVDGVDRRHFLLVTGGALTTFAHDWLFDPERIVAATRGRRIDHAVVDDLERIADARRHLDDSLGGAALLRPAREDLRLVVEILTNAAYTEDVGRRLYAVAAEFARIASGLAFDCDQPAVAQRYSLVALRAAHLSADRSLGAHILIDMSEHAKYSEPRDALRLAESALVGARDLSPAMAARVHGGICMAAACTGDARAADQASGRMLDLTAVVDPAGEPSYIYWWSEAYAHYRVGQALLALGDAKGAVDHYRRALSRLDPGYQRDRALFLTQQATAMARLGDLDGACLAAGEAAALTRRLGSERARTRLVEFRRAIAPHATAAPVRTFDTTHPDLLR
jgi:tetratricopeptide (TPR) repeat protein